MRREPTALEYINDSVSEAPQWDSAICRRLARRLGYRLIRPVDDSALSLVDYVREVDVDAVIVPNIGHVDALTLDRLMHTVDVEAAAPRETFARYLGGRHGCPA
ncbi:hypothetical protein ACIP5Y_06710 [Nocardia sp. NPDC088792]|uniref:hypothetical protein n=1 Tax=Nocardia sp. NPDC088792 TaxID=3364332 RepID=UPI003804F897